MFFKATSSCQMQRPKNSWLDLDVFLVVEYSYECFWTSCWKFMQFTDPSRNMEQFWWSWNKIDDCLVTVDGLSIIRGITWLRLRNLWPKKLCWMPNCIWFIPFHVIILKYPIQFSYLFPIKPTMFLMFGCGAFSETLRLMISIPTWWRCWSSVFWW